MSRINPSMEWDPSLDGALSTLGFQFDLKHYGSTGIDSSLTLPLRPVLRQNGVIFRLTDQLAFTTLDGEWTSALFNLDSSMAWIDQSGALVPDFTAGGAPITFGYRVGLTANCNAAAGQSCSTVSLASGIDNYQVTLGGAAPGPGGEVPEPSTLALMCAGLFSAAVLRRRRRLS